MTSSEPSDPSTSSALPDTVRARIADLLGQRDPDRAQLLAGFCRVALRRVPDELLGQADPGAVVDRLWHAFEQVDGRPPGEVRVEVLRPTVALDGSPTDTAVVQVVADDRPFLLSTITDELLRSGLPVTRSTHPIIGLERDREHRVVAIGPARTSRHRDSVLHLEVEGVLPVDEEGPLTERIRALVADVIAATDDHAAMRARLAELASSLEMGGWTDDPGHDPAVDTGEVAALLRWVLDDNLVLLGVREYTTVQVDAERCVQTVAGSGLGILADTDRSRYAEPVPIDALPERLRTRIQHAPLLTVTRTSELSPVQRRVQMVYLGLTRRDPQGRFQGELRVLGLFTRKALNEPARATPVLRRKLATIMEREDLVAGSHDAGVVLSLFQALPKDELFATTTDELHRTVVELLQAEEQRSITSLLRIDPITRSVSVLVAVPRDRYSTALRERIAELLQARFGAGQVEVELSLSERQEALVRFLLRTDGPLAEVAATQLQAEIRAIARSWDDELDRELERRVGAGETARLAEQVVARLPRSYRDTVTAAAAVPDVLLIDRALRDEVPLLTSLQPDQRALTGDGDHARVRVATRGAALELSSFLPILESLGLIVVEELPHRLTGGGPELHLHDFGVRAPRIDVASDGPRLADAVLAAWRGHLEVDGLNQLVLVAALDWRDVGLLRTYRRLRRQLGTVYTPEYVNATLVAHPGIARALVGYLHARFDPALADDGSGEQRARSQLIAELDTVARLDQDRILRGFVTLIDATLRTNAFRADAIADDTGEPYTALKLDPARIGDLPAPVPHREIFVHSPRVEGVHLRGGPVARGGLRWSDRRDDVRTEVLDLVRAQVLKNAVIVPTGAKGGFVLRQEPDDPDELRAEVRRQYVTFVRGLLDVTDDLDGERVVPPPDVRRHDGDDPYLVVAADRGTATFSDTANALAARYGFWLDDAFASGGSVGYDHKALGVTARGAWVAVQRHFRELGIDVQTEPITVAGIGDMSGDVFGNGLLRSPAVRLVAAFDHRDIFLDPDPDPQVSFAERRRLFAQPRSSWQSYDRALLSRGGAVVSRTARSVPLSDEVRDLLRIDAAELTPPELIAAILRAPVDLLFAGGIGTYIKASSERNEDVGDRANDEVRVDADQLRARVIGEGANLAITQRARVEYARHGGLVNQDAIDNAAGVSTSDHEVNAKILLALAVDDGRIDRAERDRLLAAHADEVVAIVLEEVDRQTAAIGREVEASATDLDPYRRLLDHLEHEHGLDRDAEVLPRDRELRQRAAGGAGLTRPEAASLLAWAKRDLKEALLSSGVLDAPILRGSEDRAFPPGLVRRFPDLPARHRLRRELVATVTANELVDRVGVTFARSQAAELQVPVTDVVLAVTAARQVLGVEHWWELLDAQEQVHTPARVRELAAPLLTLVGAVTTTLLSEPLPADVTRLVDRDRPVAQLLENALVGLGTADQRRARAAHARWLVDDLVEPELARLLAGARELAMVPDVAQVQQLTGAVRSATSIADAFLRLGDGLGIDRLEELLHRTRPGSPWAARQRLGLSSDLRRARRDAALAALLEHRTEDEPTAVDRWLTHRADAVARTRSVVMAAERAEDERLHAVAAATRTVWDAIERHG